MASNRPEVHYPNLQRRMTRVILFKGFQPFSRKAAMRDVFAGVNLASINIPQVLGYARIAGAPVVTGLYTVLLPLIAFAVFGSSRHLVVAANSHYSLVKVWEIFQGFAQVNVPTLALSVFVTGCVLLGNRFAPRLPIALLAVVGSIAASAAFHFSARNIAVVGPVPGGLPSIGLPDVTWKEVLE